MTADWRLAAIIPASAAHPWPWVWLVNRRDPEVQARVSLRAWREAEGEA